MEVKESQERESQEGETQGEVTQGVTPPTTVDLIATPTSSTKG